MINQNEENNIALSVKDLTRIFKNSNGAKNVSFEVTKNAFHVLIGENGAGKTTIIRSILGLYQEFSGQVKIGDIDNSDPNAFKGVSYISEHPVFPSTMTVKEYLYWVGVLSGHNKGKMKSLVNSYLLKFNLKEIAKTNPNDLSSGQKNKIMLIQVLIEQPQLLIMDEPTANLDPTARQVFYDEILKLMHGGTTIFMCTHILSEVQKYTTEATVIAKGEVMHTGELKSREKLETLFNNNVHKKDGE